MQSPVLRPGDSPAFPKIKISSRGAKRIKDGHVWVYRSDVAAADGVAPGAVVRVCDERGKFLGTAFYSSASQIAVRMISRDAIEDLDELLGERIRAAIEYRKQFVQDTDAYRVVFSEADFLPGLIVDRYNDLLSFQVLTQAMDAESVRESVLSELTQQLHPAAIGERVEPKIRELEQLPARSSGLVQGEKSSTVFSMNGVRFHYDVKEGQKTGAFLDQRENYAAAAQYARGEALDVFCYHGGFALHLARAGCKVAGVDSSRPALEVADRNAVLNGREIEWIEGNAFDVLRDYAKGGQRYDAVVLDPPAFAKSKRDLDTALRGYKELNLRALKMLRAGGI
ncbi:MAG: class I SAM-dependent rRNA methyltransferase, partial [Terriglobales bacterium]